jgi:hypothetical protein
MLVLAPKSTSLYDLADSLGVAPVHGVAVTVPIALEFQIVSATHHFGPFHLDTPFRDARPIALGAMLQRSRDLGSLE